MSDAKTDAKAIFLEALECKGADELRSFLDQACGTDPALRPRVEELLRAHRDAGAFLGGAEQQEATRDRPIVERPGTTIGPYKLLEQIGEGGFGVVFMAEQTQPMRRKVALKVLKPGMDTRQVVARFEAERQALAIMDHPHIAKVLDGGATETGRPYFVMELVRGVPITEFCDQNLLTPRQRLELFILVCQAIQHAHQKGIIHRDLKPSNVLVSRHDTTPVVKVIDFGVAKALGQVLTDKTLFTGIAQMIGTPLYMSPEQAGMSDLDIDTRSDIYSLGVLLYELLTGTTPFDKGRFTQAAYDDIRRIIREEEPPRPSTRLSDSTETLPSISALRRMEPAKLTRLVRGDLDWIVMKSLEKDRNRRYETANSFVADIERYLRDQPVLACPPSAWYRFRKFWRRNRGPLAMAAVVTAALVLVAGSIGWLARERAAEQADIARQAENSLTAARTLLADNKPALARQKLAEARGAIAGGRAAFGSLAAQIEALEAELERRQSFLNLLDRAHDEEIVDGQWQPTKAAPFTIDALAQYKVLERDDWRTWLEQGVLGKDQVEEVRRLVYEQLLWLADDVLRRRQDQRLGQPLPPVEAAQAAAAYLLKAETAWPPSQAFYRLRAQAGQALGQKELVRADFELADKTPPTMAWDYYLLGQAAYAARDRDRGIDAFEAALRLEPRHFFSLFRLGLCLCDLGRGPEDFTAAEIVFTGCIMVRPDYAHVHDSRGLACLKLKQWDKAIADYSKAIELDPKLAYAWTNRGIVYAELQQWDKALADFSKGIDLDPKSAIGWNNRGKCYCDLKQWDKAIGDHSKAIELDPKLVGAWYKRGFAYDKLGQWDKVIADDSKVIELDPRIAGAWMNRGVAYAALKQWDKALADYSKAIDLEPQDANPLNNLACLLANHPNPELRDPARAISLAKKAVALAPKEGVCWNTLGVAHYRAGDWKVAIAALQRSMELREGGDSWDWFLLAMAHEKLGDKEQARKWHDRAIQWMEKNKVEDQELSAFRAESAQLLGVGGRRK